MTILNADAPTLVLELLPRNSVSKAVLFVVQRLDEVGRVARDDMHTLYMLQDDPKPLEEALAQLDKDRKKRGLASL